MSQLPQKPGDTAGHSLDVANPPPKPGKKPRNSAMQAALPTRSLSPIATKSKVEALWYAVCFPQLSQYSSETKIAERLQQVAAMLGQISSSVSIQAPDALVFEVRSSLRYFGGIRNIRRQLQTLLQPLLTSWGQTGEFDREVQQAVSPTAAASLLLARSGCNLLVYRRDSLRSALGGLPLDRLAQLDTSTKPNRSARKEGAQARQRRQLRNSGLLLMRDLWRLPRQALAQRFGPDFVRQLDICLGQVTMPLKHYQEAPFFSTAMDFEYAVENCDILLHAGEELLGRLCAYLRQRELAAAHLQLQLRHEQRDDTLIALELRLASRSLSTLSLLLETRLQALALPAAVVGMRLQVQHFVAFTTEHQTLSGMQISEEPERGALLQLLEQLQARLGNDAVRSMHAHAEHGPEWAGSTRTFTGLPHPSEHAHEQGHEQTMSYPVASRPCWILECPSLMAEKSLKTLQLLSGPERIETRWWQDQGIERDYYVARNQQGMRLWIYHQRSDRREWYLHGIFD